MAGNRREFTLRLSEDEAESFDRFLFEQKLTAQAALKEGVLAVMSRTGTTMAEQPYGVVGRHEERIIRSVLSFLRAKEDDSPFRKVALTVVSLIAKQYQA